VNNFATVVRLTGFQYTKVRYFSIWFKENEVNEFFDFLNRIEDIPDVAEDLSNLLVWIEEIGENYGAIKNRFFRNESITADVHALPPPSREMEAHELQVEDLRLYCMVLNENVVFLFNGGIKTKDNAKDCPNVGPYIKQANRLVRLIDESIRRGEIRWNRDHTDIEFDEDLELEL
jgi:hypothetical protein